MLQLPRHQLLSLNEEVVGQATAAGLKHGLWMHTGVAFHVMRPVFTSSSACVSRLELNREPL